MATLDRDHTGPGGADNASGQTSGVLSTGVLTSAALPALYDQHFRSLVKLASMYVDDRGSAEEVVQDLSLIHI